MSSLLAILCLFSLTVLINTLEDNKLLVISFDGFRYDYVNRKITPNINNLKTKFSSAKYLINIFPTQTFPNHFSIATGLYPENHGVLQKSIYDIESKTLLTYGYKLWHYNETVLPIWTLNEKAGGTSGVMMWPGSDYEYGNIKTTYITMYNRSVEWKDRISTAFSWFKNEKKPANLVMMYFEQPDSISHRYGPNSPQANLQIQRVDETIKYIFDELEYNGLGKINVVILSDHGMESVTEKRLIDLRPIVGDIANFYGSSPVLQVYPIEQDKKEEVYKKLEVFSLKNKNFQVFKREDIPERLHYKKCTRAPPILVMANPQYGFHDLYKRFATFKANSTNDTSELTIGAHGYDPITLNMHPYFFAYGPVFKRNYYQEHLYTVDMYLLFAEILNLKPTYFDGNSSRIFQILN